MPGSRRAADGSAASPRSPARAARPRPGALRRGPARAPARHCCVTPTPGGVRPLALRTQEGTPAARPWASHASRLRRGPHGGPNPGGGRGSSGDGQRRGTITRHRAGPGRQREPRPRRASVKSRETVSTRSPGLRTRPASSAPPSAPRVPLAPKHRGTSASESPPLYGTMVAQECDRASTAAIFSLS